MMGEHELDIMCRFPSYPLFSINLQTRTWRSLNGRNCDGRYVPSMAVEISKDYRTVGCVEEPIDTEINMQLGNRSIVQTLVCKL
jgi:hypothetical protein